jgi:lysophospholipase
MQHYEGQFKGYKNLKIYFQYWMPEDTPQAVILIAHGLGEHSGYYSNIVKYFIPKGYAVWIMDQRGHGRSEGERVQFDDFHDYAVDVKIYFDMVRKNNPGKKIFLLGHSGGSIISLDFALEFQYELSGLIISGGGPAKRGETLIPPNQPLNFMGNHRDPKIIERYLNDPLVYHGPIPEKHAIFGTRKMVEISEQADQIKLPILLLAGTRGFDGDRGKALFALIGSKDKTLKLYPGLPHDLFNDPDYLKIMADMEEWLTNHS